MQKGICYIVGAGEMYSDRIETTENDYIIAADRGYLNLKAMGIEPHMLLGDFDSMPDIPEHGNILKFSSIKDKTDMGIAIDEAIKLGYTELHIYGGTGGRGDHTIANIQSLSWLAKNGIKGYLFGENEIMTAIHNSVLQFGEEMKGTVSVFSMSDRAEGVNEKGLFYTLDNAMLTNEIPLGVSNSFIDMKSEISVRKGTLLIIYEKQEKF